ncbi:MAG: NapC/NirT family cytochrome c [Candidatus Scalindua sp.]|nr:NapC/NirT family cytochrome c [Candidatus Scalindua sp.]
MDEIKNQKSVIILSVIAIISFACCISLVKIAADRPESSEFCARCHSMEPFFTSWKETVACNAGCLDCHTHDKSGRTLSVEMEDKNCTATECHPIENLISHPSQFADTLSFLHTTHIKEYDSNLRLKCTGCHSYTGREGREGGEISHFSIDTNSCFICHFTNGSRHSFPETQESSAIDDCILCHVDVQVKMDIYGKVFDHLKYEKELRIACNNCHFETVQGNGGVERKSCYYCHTKIPEGYTGAARMHKDHVKDHKVPCSPCHNPIIHKWEDEYAGFDFTDSDLKAGEQLKTSRGESTIKPTAPPVSQSGRDIFDTVPYRVQKEIYKGFGGKGITGIPDPMFLAAVNCIACHRDKGLVVEPAICNTCHERGFDTIMKEQKVFVSRMVKTLSELIKESRKQGVPNELTDTAAYNYELIMKDGSYGVHNIKYIKDLIAFSINCLKEKMSD